MGAGAGHGTTLNVPLPYYTGDTDFLRVYDELILPAVARFEPELIIVSAGYDCHWADPLAPMNVSVAGYAALAEKVYNLAADVCGGRLVCALEGGYDLRAFQPSVLATLRVLQGRPDLVEDPLGTVQRSPATDIGTDNRPAPADSSAARRHSVRHIVLLARWYDTSMIAVIDYGAGNLTLGSARPATRRGEPSCDHRPERPSCG